MSEFSFKLINNQAATLEIIWIDDSFSELHTVPALEFRTEEDVEITKANLSTFPAERVVKGSDIYVLIDTKQTYQSLDRLYQACVNCGVNLTCANFEWAEANITSGVPDGVAILLDVQNNRVSPLQGHYRVNYGKEFAERKGLTIGQNNWKFLTRVRSEIDGKYGPGVNTERQIFTSYTVLDDYESWINLLNTSFHPDSLIRCAIDMYSRPWREGWDDDFHWDHDILDKSDKKYFKVIRNWLDVGEAFVVNPEPAKCLFMRSRIHEVEYDYPPWSFKDYKTNHHFSSRKISKNVLSKALKALDIRLELKDISVPDRNWFLPISPALPFLTSLRAFQYEVNANGGPPLRELSLTRCNTGGHDTFLLQVIFEKNRSDKETRPLGLQEHYCSDWQRSPGETAKSEMTGVCGAFHNLIYCRTGNVRLNSIGSLDDKRDLEQVFVNGTPFPAVGVVFGRYGVTLIWKGQPG